MKYSNDVTMTWRMKWLNRSVVTINAMLQLLDIYRYINYNIYTYILTNTYAQKKEYFHIGPMQLGGFVRKMMCIL